MKTLTEQFVMKKVKGRYRRIKAISLDNNRIRFNWGYHDGVWSYKNKQARPDGLDKKNIRQEHYDPIYAQGWYYGWMDADYGMDKKNSEDAWQEALTIGDVSEGITNYRNI